MTRLLLRALLLGLALYLLPVEPAQAQPSGDFMAELDARVAQGIVLRRSGRDREALEEFQRAEQLSPRSARVQVHLAGTYQALGNWLRADEYLKRVLAQAGDPFVQRHLDTLQLAPRTIDEHVGLLEIDGSPANAEVRLDGQLQGSLPLAQPLRTLAGSYTLELKRGYYPARRPVTVVGGKLTREVLHLSADASAAAPPGRGAENADAAGTRLKWLPWALGGVAVAAAGVSTLAWVSRERHAERWNDDVRCQQAGQTREAVCGSERIASERAESILLVASLTAAAFTAGAVVTVLLGERGTEAAEQAGVECGMKGLWVACAGQF